MTEGRCCQIYTVLHRQHRAKQRDFREDVHREVLEESIEVKRELHEEPIVSFYSIRAATQRRSIMTPLYG